MYKVQEIGFDYSIETADSLIELAQTHCAHYPDRDSLQPINTLDKAIAYLNKFGFTTEKIGG